MNCLSNMIVFQHDPTIVFQHDMTYNKFKDLEKRTQSDVVLKNKAFKIPSNPRYNGFERGFSKYGL